MLLILTYNMALLEAMSALPQPVRPLGISHPGERGGQQRKGMINHAQIPEAPRHVLVNI